MGLIAPVILGALLIAAFALSAQQRLAIANHAPPMPARQLAYQMRIHHQDAIAMKMATPSLTGPLGVLYAQPTMFDSNYSFFSCADAKTVATFVMTISMIPEQELGTSELNSIVAELSRQSVLPQELGLMGQTPFAVGHGGSPSAMIPPAYGIGVWDGTDLHTATGLVPAPGTCAAPVGTAGIVTQVLP